MFFGTKLDAEEFDFSTKEGREKASKRIGEMLNGGTEKDKVAAKILGKLFGLMDDVPNEFALIREVGEECKKMSEKCQARTSQLMAVAKRIGDHGYPVYQFGMADSYLSVAAGALLGAQAILSRLESYVAEQSVEKKEEEKEASEAGPWGSEAPTEPPPAPPPPPHAEHVEAPLG